MASPTPRFINTPFYDNTGRVLTYDYQTPAYAPTIAVVTDEYYTLVKPARLTGAVTISADVTTPKIGDILEFVFAADGTNREVTYDTGFASAGTLTVVASKFGATRFMYNGAVWQETGRALTA